MRSSQKSGRGRGKGNRNKGGGAQHSANRVYESAGPEGKVRGTPQQIIEKYQALARDAQLSGDRVASENFLQHAEHYARILVFVQEEQERRNAQQNQNNQGNQGGGSQNGHDGGEGRRRGRDDGRDSDDQQPASDGLAALDAAQDGAPDIVETPESKGRPASRGRRPRPKSQQSSNDEQNAPAEPATEGEAG